MSQDTETAETEPAVALSEVTKTYDVGGPVEALADISLSVDRGSYTAIMGPSGSGKSTLLNLVGGLDTPTSGTVEIGGTDLTELSEPDRARLRGNEVGFVFQTFNLLPRLGAVENVALPLAFQGQPRAERIERARKLLSKVGLGDRYDHRPPQLSGGQRQRVAIARALAPEPSVILADEPTGNVDTDTGDRVMSLLGDLQDAGRTILLVSHERRVAERAERIVHIRDGVIEAIEEVADAKR